MLFLSDYAAWPVAPKSPPVSHAAPVPLARPSAIVCYEPEQVRESLGMPEGQNVKRAGFTQKRQIINTNNAIFEYSVELKRN